MAGCIRTEGRTKLSRSIPTARLTTLSVSCSNPDYGLVIQKVVLRNDLGEESSQFRPGEDLIVEISYDAQKPLEKPYVVIGVQGINGSCFTANMLLDGHRPEVLAGNGKLSCQFKSLPLFPQSYSVKMSCAEKQRDGLDREVSGCGLLHRCWRSSGLRLQGRILITSLQFDSGGSAL